MTNLKVLLVDDEEPIQKILRAVLEKEGFSVFTAGNGKIAQELLGIQKFNIVITDMNMPGSGGLELLKYIRVHYPTLPTILMTGFTKIIETKTAFDLGAKAFLAKPFKREELLKAIEVACALDTSTEKLEEVEADLPEEYCRISIDQFVSGKTIKFEIFICLNGTKYIKVAHAGEDIDMDRIKFFKSKGVHYLHIKKIDFAKYVDFNLVLANAVKGSKTISREKKMQLIRHFSAVIMENLFINGVDQEGFMQAKEITETTLSLLTDTQGGFDLLAALSAGGDHLYTHSLGVSLFSAMIAKQIKWDSPPTLFKISTAGLFHDIGMKEIDRSIVEKARALLTFEEIKQLETHAVRGAAILESVPSISGEILQTVLQHHESADGRGYPSKIPAGKIIPMARLISVADKFCELALADANAPGLAPAKVLDRLALVIVNPFDSQFLNALRVILGLDNRGSHSRVGGGAK